MPFYIIRNDITRMDVDAIVNAANNQLMAGGGVCGAIFQAAGMYAMSSACDKIGYCATGKAVITSGFNLAANHVIHAVGPIWQGGFENEEKLLADAYVNSLNLAIDNNLESVAFPLISTGSYGFPKEKAFPGKVP